VGVSAWQKAVVQVFDNECRINLALLSYTLNYPYWCPDDIFPLLYSKEAVASTSVSLRDELKASVAADGALLNALVGYFQQASDMFKADQDDLKACVLALLDALNFKKNALPSFSDQDSDQQLKIISKNYYDLAQTCNKTIKEQSDKFFKALKNARQTATKSVTVQAINFTDHPLAKQCQHEINASQAVLSNIALFLREQRQVKPVDQWYSTVGDYADYLLCQQIILPKYCQTVLDNKNKMLGLIYQYCLTQMKDIQSHFPSDDDFFEAIRRQKTIEVYLAWQRKLKHDKKEPPKEHAINYYRDAYFHWTYLKKSFFRAAMGRVQVMGVIKALKKVVNLPVVRSCELLERLQARLEEIYQAIADLEKQLTPAATFWEKMSAPFVLALSSQLSYQLGEQVSGDIHAWARRNEIPVLGGALPASDKKDVARKTGAVWLAFDLLPLYFGGRFYYSTMMLNRALFAQVNPLSRLGARADGWILPRFAAANRQLPKNYLAYFMPVVSRLTLLMRFDPQGLLEKEAVFKWCVGLCLQVLLANQHSITASAMGYVAASLSTYLAGLLVNYLAKQVDVSAKTTQWIAMLAQMFVYSRGYRVGVGVNRFLPDLRTSSPSQALILSTYKTAPQSLRSALLALKLQQMPTLDELNQTYRQLLLSLYWKRGGPVGEMQVINAARETVSSFLTMKR
jgi:hypothetical protein